MFHQHLPCPVPKFPPKSSQADSLVLMRRVVLVHRFILSFITCQTQNSVVSLEESTKLIVHGSLLECYVIRKICIFGQISQIFLWLFRFFSLGLSTRHRFVEKQSTKQQQSCNIDTMKWYIVWLNFYSQNACKGSKN